MKISISSLILLLFITLSCGHYEGINFDPDFYVANSLDGTITNERGESVSCYNPSFDNFACMTKSKVVELMQILMTAEIPTDKKELIIEKVRKLYE